MVRLYRFVYPFVIPLLASATVAQAGDGGSLEPACNSLCRSWMGLASPSGVQPMLELHAEQSPPVMPQPPKANTSAARRGASAAAARPTLATRERGTASPSSRKSAAAERSGAVVGRTTAPTKTFDARQAKATPADALVVAKPEAPPRPDVRPIARAVAAMRAAAPVDTSTIEPQPAAQVGVDLSETTATIAEPHAPASSASVEAPPAQPEVPLPPDVAPVASVAFAAPTAADVPVPTVAEKPIAEPDHVVAVVQQARAVEEPHQALQADAVPEPSPPVHIAIEQPRSPSPVANPEPIRTVLRSPPPFDVIAALLLETPPPARQVAP